MMMNMNLKIHNEYMQPEAKHQFPNTTCLREERHPRNTLDNEIMPQEMTSF